MAKPPRPSIADQIATIAATRTRDNVVTPSRDEAPPEREAAAPSPNNVATQSRGHVVTRKRGPETSDGLKIRQRVEKPHASLYAHPRVFKKLREIAAAEDCKPHDLYVQGLRMVLASYGYDLDKLESGET